MQQQALSTAQLLLNNDREQLNVGRLPPIEVARAESLVTSTQLMLTQAIALRDQQQVILRTLLDPQSLAASEGEVPEILATDPLVLPQARIEAPFPELLKRALETRPDVRQARLQVMNGERQVRGAANAAKPEVDLYGTYGFGCGDAGTDRNWRRSLDGEYPSELGSNRWDSLIDCL